MKKIFLLCMISMLAVLTGCTNYAEEYDKNTLVIKGNGSIVEIAVEDFSESSVTDMDLTAYIEKQITEYNNSQDKDVVENDTLITEDMSKVKLVLKYKDIDAYNGFNLLECTLADFTEVDEEDLKGTFTSAEGKSVKAGKLENTAKATVLIMSEKTDVVVNGDILYYNKEVSVKDGVATTTGKGDAVIIFK